MQVGNGNATTEEHAREGPEAETTENTAKRRRTRPPDTGNKGDVDDEVRTTVMASIPARSSIAGC